MPVPASRRSRTRVRNSRAHKSLTQPKLVSCPKCKKPARAHQVCAFCGNYRGRQVVAVKVKKKKEKK